MHFISLLGDWLYTDNDSSLCPQKPFFTGWISPSYLLYVHSSLELCFTHITLIGYNFPFLISCNSASRSTVLLRDALLQFHMYIKFYRRKKCDYTLFLILLLQILQFHIQTVPFISLFFIPPTGILLHFLSCIFHLYFCSNRGIFFYCLFIQFYRTDRKFRIAQTVSKQIQRFIRYVYIFGTEPFFHFRKIRSACCICIPPELL